MIANQDMDRGLSVDVFPEGVVVSLTTLAGDDAAFRKRVERALAEAGLLFSLLAEEALVDEHERPTKRAVLSAVLAAARQRRELILYARIETLGGVTVLCYHDARGGRRWLRLPGGPDAVDVDAVLAAIAVFEQKHLVLIPSGALVWPCRALVRRHRSHAVPLTNARVRVALELYSHGRGEIKLTANTAARPPKSAQWTHLDRLEAESIHIIREVMAEAENPVMLYSVGKDSSVMLHLARKAFFPSPPPFPLLHVDTRWKFQAMYDFRDYMAQESGMELLVHLNSDGVAKNINPLDHGSALHTDIMKTQSLKMALDRYQFDVAFGGARRDEEKSRAKERVFSFRTATHQWDPKNQRPELWNLYNGKKNPGESIRVFPISNWTELDIWQYIYREQIAIVPLYFAAERPVVERDGMLLMVDDDRLTIHPSETIQIKKIRFRTLGCYPLTGGFESEADDLAGIVLELLSARTSERQGRAIDSDASASMEKKKREGYF